MKSPIARNRRTRAVALARPPPSLHPGACSSSSGGSGPAHRRRRRKVGVTLITKDSTNPFFVAMQKGAKADAAKRTTST